MLPQVVDFTRLPEWLGIRRTVERYLAAIPPDDLDGISRVEIHFDSQEGESGRYYPQAVVGEARIELYANSLLGSILEEDGKFDWPFKAELYLFAKSFAKTFVAEMLFHEVGHHKHRQKVYESSREQEKHAREYASRLLYSTFPFFVRFHFLFNFFYCVLFLHLRRKSLRNLQRRHANNPKHYDMLAERLLEEGKYQEAVSALTRLIELDPLNKFAYSRRAFALENLGQPEGAAADFSRIIELDSTVGEVYAGQARYYENVEKWEEAIDDYATARTLGVPGPEILAYRAYCHKMKGRYEECKKDLEQAIREGLKQEDVSELLDEVNQFLDPKTGNKKGPCDREFQNDPRQN